MPDDIQQNNNIIPQTIPTSAINLDDEIKQFEKSYQKPIDETPSSKITRLEELKKRVDSTILAEKEAIEKELAELKDIKTRIETDIKKMNDLKDVGKEIDEDIKSVGQIDEKVKTLEEKLANLKLNV